MRLWYFIHTSATFSLYILSIYAYSLYICSLNQKEYIHKIETIFIN